ncbi:glycoside hydrolase family 13 protein [Lacrimispora sp. 210928-DFI.3.58]|uniref:glycoside hydrolase family 13 protein n=1 Tax=Lacrimispora sp. 210928-DFI.3.58 TaxID=2883214 RepID=UPI001D08C2A1|nr:alpha-glucosidase [Lacrimispora sp. 210928-DFI.3.58]MCB7318571.1 alpha-glucosidase [Lacrimispora sp. 210928-DFI.3.58]
MKEERTWWKESVVYQIYPRSFQDSNGDGIGDLNGIRRRLDYLKDLGVDVIWLSPVYQSPNDDNGYDISDYQAIMEEFGTMEDFDALLSEIHQKGMKLVMDLVVNHTSDEHPWFQESRLGRENPYRDYYIWKEPVNGGPPNNWASRFRGPAWEYDDSTGMYYLHIYSKKQPDLNWENPKLRREIYDMMAWWGRKGIDGFRMDVISMLSKAPAYPDGECKDGNPYGDGQPYYTNGPRIHEFLKEMNREVLSKFDWMTVGEGVGVGTKEALEYAGFQSHELNMMFHFEHMELNPGPYGKWNNNPADLIQLKEVLSRWQTELEGRAWNSLFWENHDYPRAVSRFGNDSPQYRELSAKMLAVCLYMMKGTPYIYQGQELGMTNLHTDSLEDFRDIEIHNVYREMVGGGRLSHEEMMTYINHTGRDNARTPMQWDDSANGGFSDGDPWIKANPNYREINAAEQMERDTSVYAFYKKLLAMRRSSELIQYGTYRLLLPESPSLFLYEREWEGRHMLVACNFTAEEQKVTISGIWKYKGKLVLDNYGEIGQDWDREPEGPASLPGSLRPYEAAVWLEDQ